MPKQTLPGHAGFGTTSRATERRVHIRYVCESDVALQPLANRKTVVWRVAHLENISAKGMALVCDTTMERGTLLSVKLKGSAQRFARPLLVRVIRVSERPGDLWRIGCTFAIPLDEDEISALMQADNVSQESRRPQQAATPRVKQAPAVAHDPFVHGSALERRCVHRRRLSTAIVLSYGVGFHKSLEALAIDGSVGGLKLLSRKPFSRGDMLRVRVTKAAASVPSVEVRVQSCRPQQTQWILGVQFIKPPSSDVMLSLG